MKSKLIALAVSGLIASTSSQATSLNKTEIDNVFSEIKSTSPGCSVGVIKDGKLIHKAGYGLANMELNVPLDGSHVHRIASVSKQFTGMAVILLADEGKIDLNADIRKYLPELRDYKESVTINAMLGHFSGMGDYDFVDAELDKDALKLKSTMGGEFRLGKEDYLTIEEFYDYVKTVPLRNKPNEDFRYSNYAYFLLSMLVERVSGESLRDYSETRIFRPLGMSNTFFSDEPTEIVRNRADGYSKNNEGEYFTNMTNLFWVGDGGLHTTVEDMAKWDAYFYNPTLGKEPKKLLAQFMQPNNAEITIEGRKYANGQFIGEKSGIEIVYHSGGWLGTVTNYERIPEKNYASIVFCNDTSVDIAELVGGLRKLVL
ncbi:penicillin-binding protein [Pseudoalteromonas phenolica]|uniref:serine hydrolase domain-containing protein n=1 Tax=Pseudoalteromonas phenolica TaxID=161398 RepID=UPI00110B76E0|nr:serine hydrolase domain-containing protein [Pseudoalteromonas phenolica]TMN88054.1 penicillin-binding protein [Pseudoalteromonas phenolica]